LGCPYCFCGKKYKQDMDIETLEKAIAFYDQVSTGRECTITFFGGEPMLKFNLIKHAINLNNTIYKSKYKFSITTNGTLFNSENTEYLKNNNVSILLSLDGDKESHDMNRFYLSNKEGSWETVMKNAEKYFNNQLPVRLTFTPQTVSNLYTNIEMLLTKGFRNIAFYPACGSIWKNDDIENFEKQIEKIAALYLNEYKNNNSINIHWIDKSIRSHILGGGSKCMPAISQFSVTPDGSLYPCNRTNFSNPSLNIGSLDKGFKTEKIIEIREELLKTDPECEGCSLKDRCNACPMEMLEYTKTLYKIPGWFCNMNQCVIKAADKAAECLFKEKNELFMNAFYLKNIKSGVSR